MNIIIFDGSFKTTTFINRLIEGLSTSHTISVIGFNENIDNKIKGVNYVGLGSNNSKSLFLIRSIQLRKLNFRKQFLLFYKLFKRRKKDIQEENIQLAIDLIKPDIIHFQWLSLLIYLDKIILPKGTKTVLSQRGSQLNITPFIDKDNMSFLKNIYPKINGFHSVSLAIKNKSKLIYNSLEKIDEVVYSGFNINDLPLKKGYVKSEKIQIISIGREHWVKGYTYAIKAMSELLKQKIKFHYTIVGVALSEELLFLVNDLDLGEHVSFVDKVTQNKVYKYITDSDLLLLPSIEEGIANVCVEAMLCKTPVMSTNCGGMAELIRHHKTGILVPKCNYKAMSLAIVDFMNMDHQKINEMCSEARKHAVNHHSEYKMVRGMEKLYNKVLKS